MDEAIINVGDELVVRIAGYPVGKAVVKRINEEEGVVVSAFGRMIFDLPLDFTPVDEIDGVDHTRKVLE